MMQSQQFNEIMIEVRRRELDRINPHIVEAMKTIRAQHGGLRHSVAAALVRLGMCLDRDAGARVAPAR
jgi:hypothetical protein